MPAGHTRHAGPCRDHSAGQELLTPRYVIKDTVPQTDAALAPLITHPEMDAVYFGVAVAYIGEDGDLIALGHSPPRRVLAAFHRHARLVEGETDELRAAWERPAVSLTQSWARFRRPDPAMGEDRDARWWVDWCTSLTPEARPVTLLGSR